MSSDALERVGPDVSIVTKDLDSAKLSVLSTRGCMTGLLLGDGWLLLKRHD